MFKKVSALVLMLVMLLVSAPLILAQVPGVQYTSQSQLPQVAQQNAGQNQPPQSGQQPTSQNQLPQSEQQTTSQNQPTQSGQQNAGQNQPPQSGQQNASQNQSAQSPISSLKDLTELDANNNLVVNCGALIERLAHFQQIGKDTIANDPNLQLEMMQATDLAQLCTADGFANNGQPSSTTPTNGGQQPSNTTPTNGEQSSGSTPTNGEQPSSTTPTNSSNPSSQAAPTS